MTGDLLINSKDAYTYWGVSMGTGFLKTLWQPLELKDRVSNEVRDEHGTRYYEQATYYVKERTISLPFVLVASSETDFIDKQKGFFDELMSGQITLSVPALRHKSGQTYVADVFRLNYTGKSATYEINTKRNVAKLTMQFIEPNPKNR